MEAREDPADSNPALLALRNEFFRRSGRNVWLFQSVEALLKGLALAGRARVSLAEPAKHAEAQVESVARRSMGMLTRDLLAGVLASDSEAAPPPENDMLQWSLRLADDGGFSESLRAKLGALVNERNELVHHGQARWDIADVSAMQEALDALDAQRERILDVHADLRRLGLWVQQTTDAMLDYMGSPEFKDEWRLVSLQSALLDAVQNAGRADGWSPLTQVGQLWRLALEKKGADERRGLPSLRCLLDASGCFEWREQPNPGGGHITYCRLRPQTAPESER